MKRAERPKSAELFKSFRRELYESVRESYARAVEGNLTKRKEERGVTTTVLSVFHAASFSQKEWEG